MREDFARRAYEGQQTDVLVSERLTHSPYVMDIYGHCGLTAIYELGTANLAEAVAQWKWRNIHPSLNKRFEYAYQIASALADLHGFDYPLGNNSTVAHRDWKPENVMLSVQGVAKLTDFNYGCLRYWNKTDGNKQCPFHSFPFLTTGYRPAEMELKKVTPLSDNADVFGMGGLMFLVFADENPYHDYTTDDVRSQAILSGKLPTTPTRFSPLANQTREVQVMFRLIHRCMALDPSQRPTAKQVKDILDSLIGNMEQH